MPKKAILLSYPLSANRFYYAGAKADIKAKVSEGERFNRQTVFNITSHFGTHIDFPSHFYRNGKSGEDYQLEAFFFKKVRVAERDVLSNGQGIDMSFVNDRTPQDAELILFKTHYCRVRDDERYWKDSPVVEPSLADDLRKIFPKLRMVGFDTISISSNRDKEKGRMAHLRFLDESEGREILLVEDMDLRMVNGGASLNRVMVIPLIYDNMDGSPCTIIAVTD